MLQIETSQAHVLPEVIQPIEHDARVDEFYDSIGLLSCGGSVYLQNGDPWNPGSVPDRHTVRAVVQLSSVTQAVSTEEIGPMVPRIGYRKENPSEAYLLGKRYASRSSLEQDATKLDVARKIYPLFDEDVVANAFYEADDAVNAAFGRSRTTVQGYTKKPDVLPDLIEEFVAKTKIEAERPTKISEGSSFKPNTRVLGAAVITEGKDGVGAGLLITSHLLRAARLATGSETHSNLPYSHRSLGADRVINLIGSRILTDGLRSEFSQIQQAA